MRHRDTDIFTPLNMWQGCILNLLWSFQSVLNSFLMYLHSFFVFFLLDQISNPSKTHEATKCKWCHRYRSWPACIRRIWLLFHHNKNTTSKKTSGKIPSWQNILLMSTYKPDSVSSLLVFAKGSFCLKWFQHKMTNTLCPHLFQITVHHLTTQRWMKMDVWVNMKMDVWVNMLLSSSVSQLQIGLEPGGKAEGESLCKIYVQ